MIRSVSLTTALAFTLLAVACGGDDNGATADPAATTAASPAPAVAVAPRPSAGCTKVGPPAGVSEQTLAVGAESGSYREMVPSAAGDARPLPLIIDLHGLGTPTADEAAITGFEALGEQQGAFVLTPNGIGPASAPGNNSIEFLTELLDVSEQRLCVDTARVFMGGMSLGGLISSIVGCQLEDRIAAIGAASGLRFPADCALSRPLPVMVFHGKLDVVTQYFGGQGYTSNPDIAARTPPALPPADTTAFGQDWLPVETIVAQWAEANGCSAEPEATQAAEHVELRTFVGCADGSAIEFYVIEDGQHAWPGTDPETAKRTCGDCVAERFEPTQEIQATPRLWEFWMQHPLVEPGS